MISRGALLGAALVLALPGLALPGLALAAPRLRYEVSLAARAQGKALVRVEIEAAPAPLTLVFPAWLPGAYELRWFGRGVSALEAKAAEGALTVAREGDTRVLVRGHAPGARVELRYTIDARLLSDDGAELSDDHAYLNPGAVLPLVRGLEHAPHALSLVDLPKGWRVLAALDGDPARALAAPGYEALIDGPIEAAPEAALSVSTRRIEGAELTVAVHHEGRPAIAPPAALWADLERLVPAQRALAGPLPYRRYLLLVHLTERSDRVLALEHAAATSVVIPPEWLLSPRYQGPLRHIVAHELFHAWNARRLVPATMLAWDPERPQPSRELWITEGLTEYAAVLSQTRAGLLSPLATAKLTAVSLARAREAEACARSVEQLSELPFAPPDACVVDDAHYPVGHVVWLAIGAELLARSAGKIGPRELLAALLPPPDAPPRAIDRARLAQILDGLVPPGGAAFAEVLARWVVPRFSMSLLLPTLRSAGIGPRMLEEAASSPERERRARLLGLKP